MGGGLTLERTATLAPADRAAVLDFWVRAWTPIVPTIDFDSRRDWLVAHLAALVAAGAVPLLARDAAGTPRGFLTLHPVTGCIDQLAVDPDTAGQGIGRALMAEAKRLAPPTGLCLTVNQDNARALRFYRAAGFAATGHGVNARSCLATVTMAWPGSPEA